MKIKVGSRESRLAVIQSEIIINEIQRCCPSVEAELVTMKTTGDKILDRTLDKIGGKGLFVKELDRALLCGEVDITVHSLKDMPMEENADLPVCAYSRREMPYDVLVLPKGADKLDEALPIGSSSLRRAVQLKRLFPNIEIKPVRGNVITRLDKLDRGEYGALVLAGAGLMRLGLEERISRVFTSGEIIPAAGQGIIAVQSRSGNAFEFLDMIDDKNSRACALAERAFVRRLNGGCSSPTAAFAQLEGDTLTLVGLHVKNGEVIIKKSCGVCTEAEKIGTRLAEEMI